MSAKDAKASYMKVSRKQQAFIKKVRKAGAKNITSETYAISRDSPKGALHRAVVYYDMPKGKYVGKKPAKKSPTKKGVFSWL